MGLSACGTSETPKYYDKEGNELDETISRSLEMTKEERAVKARALTNPTVEQFLDATSEDRRRTLSIKKRNGIALTEEENRFLEEGNAIVSSNQARQITDERTAALKAKEARVRAALAAQNRPNQ